MSNSPNVATALRQLRAQRGESLRAVAKGVGIDVAHLARVESGEKEPSEKLCERLSDYYEIEPDAVYLAAGKLPPDLIDLLLANPGEVARLRARLGPSQT